MLQWSNVGITAHRYHPLLTKPNKLKDVHPMLYEKFHIHNHFETHLNAHYHIHRVCAISSLNQGNPPSQKLHDNPFLAPKKGIPPS